MWMPPRTWQPVTSRQRTPCWRGSLLVLTSPATCSALNLQTAPSGSVHNLYCSPKANADPTVCWVCGTCSGMFVSSFRRWCWVRLRCHTTWLSSKHPPNIQSACRPSLGQREAEWSLLSSPPVSRLLHTLERFQVTVMSIYSVISNARTNRIYSLFTFSFRDTELSC